MLLQFCLLLSYFLSMVGVLISVAFMILFERKVLGYVQLRKGPNKVGVSGIIQSFSDAMKLFLKEYVFSFKVNFMFFYWAPVGFLLISLLMWCLLLIMFNCLNSLLSGLLFFCCTSFIVYSLISSGWASNSNYAMLGTMRNIAQTISYEVSLALIYISIVFLVGSYGTLNLFSCQYLIWFIYLYFPLFLCWTVSMLAESNRTPFDFAEGESELVSGFNVEYSSGGFTFLFLSEYASIIFMSFFISLLFFGGGLVGGWGFILMGCFFVFFFVWVRGCLPRYRYDKLMFLMWKGYLPTSLFLILFYQGYYTLVYFC